LVRSSYIFILYVLCCLGKTCSIILKSEAQNSINGDSHPHSAAVADFNNDGLLDIVVANSGTNNIGVFLRSDNNTFTNQMTYSTGSNSVPYAVAVGDFNKDQRLDIVVANFGTNNIGIFLGTANGTFTSQTTFSTGSSRPRWVAVGDFINDTVLDIAVVNYGTTRCPSVTESRFFPFSLQYLRTFQSIKVDYFDKIYKLTCPTYHKSSIRFRSSFTNLKLKTMPVTESAKMVMRFQYHVKN
jgi:hypothetical protein